MALLDWNSDFGKSLGKKLRSSNSSYMAKFFLEQALCLKVLAFDLSMNHLNMGKITKCAFLNL